MIRKLMLWLRLKFLNKKNKVFYIGGNDTLPPPLSAEEEHKAILGFMAGSKIDRDLLIEHNLRLVVYIAKKFESAGVIESRSSGMKGTYIKVLNDVVFDELDKIKKENHKNS